jgi:hypothetical protein
MTPETQLNKILNPATVVILDMEAMKRHNLSFDIVFAAWDRGILLNKDIYTIKTKEEALVELQNRDK